MLSASSYAGEVSQSSASHERPRKKLKESLSKRAPYVASACDFCHGRKLKCSGDRPCARCKKHHVSCSYPTEVAHPRRLTTTAPTAPVAVEDLEAPGLDRRNTQGVTQMQTDVYRNSTSLLDTIDSLQRQLTDLKAQLNQKSTTKTVLPSSPAEALPSHVAISALNKESAPPAMLKQDTDTESSDVYAGATSYAFSITTADSRLSIIPGPSGGQGDAESTPAGDHGEEQTPSSATVSRPAKDDLSLEDWTVQDVLQLVDTFQSVFGILHPMPHIDHLKLNASTLLRAAKRSLWTRPIQPGQCGLL